MEHYNTTVKKVWCCNIGVLNTWTIGHSLIELGVFPNLWGHREFPTLYWIIGHSLHKLCRCDSWDFHDWALWLPTVMGLGGIHNKSKDYGELPHLWSHACCQDSWEFRLGAPVGITCWIPTWCVTWLQLCFKCHASPRVSHSIPLCHSACPLSYYGPPHQHQQPTHLCFNTSPISLTLLFNQAPITFHCLVTGKLLPTLVGISLLSAAVSEEYTHMVGF
jgi:hypothetical protein